MLDGAAAGRDDPVVPTDAVLEEMRLEFDVTLLAADLIDGRALKLEIRETLALAPL